MSAKQNDGGCVTVTWEIRNFGLYLDAKEVPLLWSPFWKVGSAGWGQLCLWYIDSQVMGKIVFQEAIPGCKEKLFLVSSRGEVQLQLNLYSGYSIIGRSAFSGHNRQSLIPNDILTLRCRIWNKTIRNRDLSIVSDLYGVNYVWNIENFGAKNSYNLFIEQDSFLLYVFLTKKINRYTTHVVTFEGHCAERFISFVDCKICFKNDGDGLVEYNTYPPLYAKWKCFVKILTESNTNFCAELESIVALHKMCPEQVLANTPEEIAQSSGELSDDFLHIFEEKLLCDATLTAKGQSLPAHKVVLAARSPVFCAMFEKKETSEGRSGVVVIDDIDIPTLERMLVFLYGGTLGEFSWEEASALYYAADKYDVRSLKQKCSELLKAGMTADNVCGALVLADKHSDQNLMTCVVDYLFEHQEVISSTLWEELEDSQPRLCAKITRQLLFKKRNSC